MILVAVGVALAAAVWWGCMRILAIDGEKLAPVDRRGLPAAKAVAMLLLTPLVILAVLILRHNLRK